jgi:hypothetical protein
MERSAACKHHVFGIAVLTTMKFVWAAIDPLQKSSVGTKQTIPKEERYWPGAVSDTNFDMAAIGVTTHNHSMRPGPAPGAVEAAPG